MAHSSKNNPKTIVITGASSGIGKALALHYAAPETNLLIHGRNAGRLEELAVLCEKKGARVNIGIFDIRDKSALQKWVDMSPIDLVIANAGISGGTAGSPNGEPGEQVHEIFDVNLTGVLNTVEVCIPDMIARGNGQIALMSSLAGFRGLAGAPAYSASKAAVRVYGEGLRGACKPFGIKINVICPGFIRTPMTAVNPYTMPFMMDVDAAATLIAKKLANNTGRIAFPWQMYAIAGFFGLLPDNIAQEIMRYLPSKPKIELEFTYKKANK